MKNKNGEDVNITSDLLEALIKINERSNRCEESIEDVMNDSSKSPQDKLTNLKNKLAKIKNEISYLNELKESFEKEKNDPSSLIESLNKLKILLTDKKK